jgi:hypothetical protein
LLEPVGVVGADVRVGVVERHVAGLGDEAVPPRADEGVDVEHGG